MRNHNLYTIVCLCECMWLTRVAESSQVYRKRSFDAAFKLKVIEFAEQNTNRSAARKYGVDEKRVRDWKKQED